MHVITTLQHFFHIFDNWMWEEYDILVTPCLLQTRHWPGAKILHLLRGARNKQQPRYGGLTKSLQTKCWRKSEKFEKIVEKLWFVRERWATSRASRPSVQLLDRLIHLQNQRKSPGPTGLQVGQIHTFLWHQSIPSVSINCSAKKWIVFNFRKLLMFFFTCHLRELSY